MQVRRALAKTLVFLILLAWPGLMRAEPQVFIARGSPEVKAVALTFDDGPSPYTWEIMSLLNRHRAHATFFVLGCHAAKYPKIIQALLRSGHEVENHSFSHIHFSQADAHAWEKEIGGTEGELALLGVKTCRLFRPPYSDYNTRLLNFLGHVHERAVLWSVDSGDWRGISDVEIAANVLRGVHNGAIVVLHDSDEHGRADRRNTVEALKILLPCLKSRGYKLVTVSELLESCPKAKDDRPPQPLRLL